VKKAHLVLIAIVLLTVALVVTAFVVVFNANYYSAVLPDNIPVTNMGFVYMPIVMPVPSDGRPASLAVVTVTEVYPNSLADKAGLKAGDLILSYNGTRLTEEVPLFGIMRRCAGGTTVNMEIMRNNAVLTIRATCPSP